MSAFHIVVECHGGEAAAGHAIGCGVVIIAHPDAGNDLWGIADKPSIPEILAGAGFGGDIAVFEFAFAAGARFQHLHEPDIDFGDCGGVYDLFFIRLFMHIKYFALGGADFDNTIRHDSYPAIGEHGISAGHFEEVHFAGAESKAQDGF